MAFRGEHFQFAFRILLQFLARVLLIVALNAVLLEGIFVTCFFWLSLHRKTWLLVLQSHDLCFGTNCLRVFFLEGLLTLVSKEIGCSSWDLHPDLETLISKRSLDRPLLTATAAPALLEGVFPTALDRLGYFIWDCIEKYNYQFINQTTWGFTTNYLMSTPLEGVPAQGGILGTVWIWIVAFLIL